MSSGMALISSLMLFFAMPAAGQIIVRDDQKRALVAVDSHGDLEQVTLLDQNSRDGTAENIETVITREKIKRAFAVDSHGGLEEIPASKGLARSVVNDENKEDEDEIDDKENGDDNKPMEGQRIDENEGEGEINGDGDTFTEYQAAGNADYASDAVVMPAAFLEREAPPPSFKAAPAGSTQNLFIPAIHRCNDDLKQEFFKMHPEQAKKTPSQTNLAELFHIVNEVNTEKAMPTILNCGSVLGFFRNCDVIPGDGDGDTILFGHWLQGERSIEKLTAAYARRNVTLESRMCQYGPLYTGCEMVVKHPTLGHIDIFVWAPESDCDEAPCNFFGSFYTAFHKNGTVGPAFHKFSSGKIHFEQARFLDMTVWIQTPTLDFIKMNYGDQWEDPTGGKYKAVAFGTNTMPVPDTFGAKIPSAEYVKHLEPHGKRSLEQQLLKATPAK